MKHVHVCPYVRPFCLTSLIAIKDNIDNGATFHVEEHSLAMVYNHRICGYVVFPCVIFRDVSMTVSFWGHKGTIFVAPNVLG